MTPTEVALTLCRTAQIAASSEVQVVALEDVSADLLAKEREIELQKEDLAKKPEAIR